MPGIEVIQWAVIGGLFVGVGIAGGVLAAKVDDLEREVRRLRR